MNCPSRTDDAELEHPTWNQNPPFLAADLTTCQDLNGIANSREHKGVSDGEVDGLPPAVKATLFEKPPDTVASLVSWARVSGECQPCLLASIYLRAILSSLFYLQERCDLGGGSLVLTTCCSNRTRLALRDGCQW